MDDDDDDDDDVRCFVPASCFLDCTCLVVRKFACLLEIFVIGLFDWRLGEEIVLRQHFSM